MSAQENAVDFLTAYSGYEIITVCVCEREMERDSKRGEERVLIN